MTSPEVKAARTLKSALNAVADLCRKAKAGPNVLPVLEEFSPSGATHPPVTPPDWSFIVARCQRGGTWDLFKVLE